MKNSKCVQGTQSPGQKALLESGCMSCPLWDQDQMVTTEQEQSRSTGDAGGGRSNS